MSQIYLVEFEPGRDSRDGEMGVESEIYLVEFELVLGVGGDGQFL